MIKCICGLPNAGKNQLATKLAIDSMRNGFKVYSSYPIKTRIRSYNPNNLFRKVEVRSFVIDKQMFLNGEFELGSTIIFDEAWLDFFNQDWKKVDKNEMKKYNGSRHLGLTLYYITQNPNRIIPYLRDVTDSYLWLERKLFFNKITEYFELENLGKIVGEELGQLSPHLVNRSIYFRKKSIMLSYNDSYLKDGVILDNSRERMHDTFDVEYRSLFKRIKAYYKRKIAFRKSLVEPKKEDDNKPEQIIF